MQNRAIQNSYSPGSIFKLIMADAGLEEGLLEDDPAVHCSGAANYYGRTFHCAHKEGHGLASPGAGDRQIVQYLFL